MHCGTVDQYYIKKLQELICYQLLSVERSVCCCILRHSDYIH